LQRKPSSFVKHGNGIAVTMPRAVVHALGFNLGDLVTVEINERHEIIIRRPVTSDFQPKALQPYIKDSPAPSVR